MRPCFLKLTTFDSPKHCGMEDKILDGRIRSNIAPGQFVAIVKKQHQASGLLTEGEVKRILTKSPQHPHGIKVMLSSGEVGRVKEILPE